jgi:sugar transferase EpsL
MYRDIVKRALDILVAALALIVLSPVFLALTLMVALTLGRPVLFTQMRAGRNGMPFKMVKFRSMTGARDSAGELLPDAERLPPIGHFLRATSLDELPELWNVLKGDMSIVGPRPLLMDYLPLYSDEQRRRHNVRPGITGWAQVNGRNSLSWKDKFAFDVWYVDNCSFTVDAQIVAWTFFRVLKSDGIRQPGNATAERFRGNVS